MRVLPARAVGAPHAVLRLRVRSTHPERRPPQARDVGGLLLARAADGARRDATSHDEQRRGARGATHGTSGERSEEGGGGRAGATGRERRITDPAARSRARRRRRARGPCATRARRRRRALDGEVERARGKPRERREALRVGEAPLVDGRRRVRRRARSRRRDSRTAAPGTGRPSPSTTRTRTRPSGRSSARSTVGVSHSGAGHVTSRRAASRSGARTAATTGTPPPAPPGASDATVRVGEPHLARPRSATRRAAAAPPRRSVSRVRPATRAGRIDEGRCVRHAPRRGAASRCRRDATSAATRA